MAMLDKPVEVGSWVCESKIELGCNIRTKTIWRPIMHWFPDSKLVLCISLSYYHQLYSTFHVCRTSLGSIIHNHHLILTLSILNKYSWVYRIEVSRHNDIFNLIFEWWIFFFFEYISFHNFVSISISIKYSLVIKV